MMTIVLQGRILQLAGDHARTFQLVGGFCRGKKEAICNLAGRATLEIVTEKGACLSVRATVMKNAES